jgi:tetratricopeptide (TPR) repeat protein
LFQIIYDDYKNRSIVNAAADKLNKPLIDLNFDPAKDQYASAEDLMLAGNYSQSINKFFNIYREFPKSAIAPQALYTSGWILENDLFMPDSAASVYDTLISKYPKSVYVKNISKKVTAYKQEKVRIQKAIDDSLSALKKIELDSTVIAVNTEKDSVDMVAEVFGGIVANTKIDEETTNQLNNEIVDSNKTAGTTPKKKLEPLWDPRKHFN